MAQTTLWSERVVTSNNPEIRSTVICNYEKVGTKLQISVTTRNHCLVSSAWRHNRWAMDVSINGQRVGSNIQIKARTSGYIGTTVYEAKTPTYTIDIGNKTSVPISIYYYDTGWTTARNITTSFNTLTGTLSGIPSLPTVSLSANYSYPNLTHNSLRVNYSVSGTYDYVRVWVDGKQYADVKSTPFTVTGLSANTSHTIYARAHGSGGFGANSNTLSFKTFVTPVSVSSGSIEDLTPFGCTAIGKSNNASNTQQYEFAICDTTSNRNVKKGPYTTLNTYYKFTGLEEETSYYLRIRVQTKGSGAWSDYIYILFTTPADQISGYVQTDEGIKKGKGYFKNPDTGEWCKAKKVWIKINGEWKLSINMFTNK